MKAKESKGKFGSCWSLNLDAESQLTSSSYDKHTTMASNLPSWLHKYKEENSRTFEVICAPVQTYVQFICYLIQTGIYDFAIRLKYTHN